MLVAEEEREAADQGDRRRRRRWSAPSPRPSPPAAKTLTATPVTPRCTVSTGGLRRALDRAYRLFPWHPTSGRRVCRSESNFGAVRMMRPTVCWIGHSGVALLAHPWTPRRALASPPGLLLGIKGTCCCRCGSRCAARMLAFQPIRATLISIERRREGVMKTCWLLPSHCS
jgi:hypothetical protein